MADKKIYRRACKECGQEFVSGRADAVFCGGACRQAFNNRRLRRGAQLYDAAMEYRDKRERGGLAELTTIIDRFLQQDREAGRVTYFDKAHRLKYE